MCIVNYDKLKLPYLLTETDVNKHGLGFQCINDFRTNTFLYTIKHTQAFSHNTSPEQYLPLLSQDNSYYI